MHELQHGIWFTERLGGIGTVYHMPLAISFDGDLDVDALRRACRALVERHPVLATAVSERDGVPHLVAAASEVPIDLTNATAEDLERRVRREVIRPFDLSRGPLARFTLYALGSRRFLLLFVAHHLVFDGESKDIFVRDLAALYTSAPLDPLPPAPPRPPGDAREFWRDRRHSVADVVLPGAGRAAGGPGESYELALPIEPPHSLGVTRFEFLLGTLQALLCRYGNEDVGIAIELGARTEPTRDHIGHFVNELPVVSGPDLSSSCRAHVTGLRADLRRLYRVREVPLARSVNGIRPGTALAPISLSYRKRTATPVFTGLRTEVRWMMFNHAARNALHIQVVDGPDGAVASLRYSARSIDRDSVRRIAGHLTALLESAAADPDILLRDLPLATADESVAVGTTVDIPAQTLHGLVEAQVARGPDAVAISGDRDELTYAELNARANDLAGRLRDRGVAAGGLVAICADRSIDLVVGLLGILKAGAAYLPLDPAYPPDRLAYLLADSAAGLVVVQKRLIDRLPEHAAEIVVLDETGAARTGQEPGAGPSDLAYLLYTSGSTGRPKGVQIEHRSVVNLLLAMRDLLGSGPDDVWLGLTSPSFDISVLEMFLPLVTGGRLVLTSDSSTVDGVTHVQATPSGWELLLESDVDYSAVTALCGGEALTPALAQRLRARVKRLWNMYGPTETTIWSTAAEVGEEVTLGRPIANTRLYVLDEGSRPVPVGVAGELFIAGAGLARGYLNRPELTAERFPDDPFAPGRMYRTGDRVRWRPDGSLEFLGRTDSQIKLRGHRIELGEIESVLAAHPAVRAAAVAVHGDRLVAYVVGRTDGVREHLAAILPDYMVPAVVLPVDALPLTPNGKLDRAALPEPPTPPRERPAAPVSTHADEVVDIVREVLRIDDVDPREDLFELGVNSLTIMQIAARIRRRLKVDLPLHAFYDTPTVAEIAGAVADRRGRG